MNCLEFHNLVHRRLDGDKPPQSADAAAHLAQCPQCRALQSAVSRLENAIPFLRPPQPPRYLGKQIVAKVLARRRQMVQQRIRRWVSVAVAAVVLIAAFAGYSGVFHRPQRVVEKSIATHPRSADETQSASLQKNLDEAGSALANLFSRTTEGALEQGRVLLPGAVSLPPLPDALAMRSTLSPPVETLRMAGHGVSTGLEPIASSARRAVNWFLQDIPGL
jgi:hypothetical protein